MSSNRVAIIGLGTQGHKRARLLGNRLVATVDPINPEARFTSVSQLDPITYESVYICTPENVKMKLIKYFLDLDKNILVEKPLMLIWDEYKKLEYKTLKSNKTLYIAYNHRFEPAIIKVKNWLLENKIGKVYAIDMVYSNGTAELVRNSGWRDSGLGVIPDLTSHLHDILMFWFPEIELDNISCHAWAHENLSPDRSLIYASKPFPINMDVNLISWKNDFRVKIFGEEGNIVINGLCKWSPSFAELMIRIHPSGVPKIIQNTFEYGDPTWQLEMEYFDDLVKMKNTGNLSDSFKFSKFLDQCKKNMVIGS